MKKRCGHRRKYGAKYYAGRGITYDPRWKDFEAFLVDMGERPEGLTLDRRDNDKGYSKDNCRWATPTQQTRNRGIARVVTMGEETKPIAEWAKDAGIPYNTLLSRLRRWPIDVALTRPPGLQRGMR
jgi:hypothetical protein